MDEGSWLPMVGTGQGVEETGTEKRVRGKGRRERREEKEKEPEEEDFGDEDGKDMGMEEEE